MIKLFSCHSVKEVVGYDPKDFLVGDVQLWDFLHPADNTEELVSAEKYCK